MVSIKDVIRTCNLTIRFSKFTLNIKIYDEFVGFLSKLIWIEILFNWEYLFLNGSPELGKVLINSWFFNESCKVVIYKDVVCWLLFCAKFDCNYIQSFVPCIYYGI